MNKFVLLAFVGALVSCSSTKNLTQLEIADPTINYCDGKYYLYGTGSNVGIRVYESKDLKTWTIPADSYKGHVMMRGMQAFGTKGFWAPQMMHHDGSYYLLYVANEEIAIAKSDSPYGLFKQDKVECLKAPTKQIDPFLFVDEDGKEYLYHVRLKDGNNICVATMNDDMATMGNDIVPCITATEPWENTNSYPSVPIIEGPTVLKHKGFYYLFYSANHFMSQDYAVGYAVSKSPLGPWEKPEGNPILSSRLLPEYKGTGHGDLFQDKKGGWKYVFHTHYSKTQVHPRRTMVVDIEFYRDENGGADKVRIKVETARALYLKK